MAESGDTSFFLAVLQDLDPGADISSWSADDIREEARRAIAAIVNHVRVPWLKTTLGPGSAAVPHHEVRYTPYPKTDLPVDSTCSFCGSFRDGRCNVVLDACTSFGHCRLWHSSRQDALFPILKKERIWVEAPDVKGGGYHRMQLKRVERLPPATEKGVQQLVKVSVARAADLKGLHRDDELNKAHRSSMIDSFWVSEKGAAKGFEMFIKQANVIDWGDVKMLVNEVLASQSAQIIDLPSQSTKLIPPRLNAPFLSRPSMSRTPIAATMHSRVPGQTFRQLFIKSRTASALNALENAEGTEDGSKEAALESLKAAHDYEPGLVPLVEKYRDLKLDGTADERLEAVIKHPDLARIAAFDSYSLHTDRNTANLMYRKDEDRFYAIDGGMAFSADWTAIANREMDPEYDYRQESSPLRDRWILDFSSALKREIDDEREFSPAEISNLNLYAASIQALSEQLPPSAVIEIQSRLMRVATGQKRRGGPMSEKDIERFNMELENLEARLNRNIEGIPELSKQIQRLKNAAS